MLAILAWRNVWRSPFRSALLIASVAVGLWAGLFMMAFGYGMVDQYVRAGIDGEVSHFQIHAPGFKPEFTADRTIPGGAALAQRLRAGADTRAVSARTLARGMLSEAHGAAGVEIRGVDAAAENATTGMGGKIIQGAFLQASGRNAIVVGAALARKRGLKPQAKVVLTFQDAQGGMAAGAFRVAGVYKSTDAHFDEAMVFVPRATLNRLLGLDSDAVQEIAVRLRRGDAVDSAVAAVRALRPKLVVESWRQLAPELAFMQSGFEAKILVILVITLLGLAFGIMNTMLMSVLERTREIGMLMALGMHRRRVFGMILIETVFIVFAGCPFGLGAAALTTAVLGRTGINLSHWAQGLSSFGFDSFVYPKLLLRHYFETLALVSVTAVLSALLPARQALKLRPVEAIRSL